MVHVDGSGCVLSPATPTVDEARDAWLRSSGSPLSPLWFDGAQQLAVWPRAVGKLEAVTLTDKQVLWSGTRGGDTRTICIRPRTAAVERALYGLVEREASCWTGPPAEMLVSPRVAFPADEKYVDVSVSSDRACAVSTSGALRCCGRNQGTVPQGRFQAVSLSETFSCALDGEGHVACWAARGEQPKSLPGTFKQIAVNLSGACGLTTAGAVACSASVPPTIPAGPLIAFALGEQCGVGLRADHSLAFWSREKAATLAGAFVAVGAEPTRSCGLSRDGTLTCRNDELDPVPSVPAPVSVFSMSPGMTCGLAGKPGGPPGGATCWRIPDLRPLPVASGNFARVSASRASEAACGIRPSGAVECWGEFYPALATRFPRP